MPEFYDDEEIVVFGQDVDEEWIQSDVSVEIFEWR